MSRRSLAAVLGLSFLVACAATGSTSAQRSDSPVQPRANEPPSYVIFFDMGKSGVNARGVATVREAAAAARRPGVQAVEVTGHTARTGSDHANEALSWRRARVVRDLLVRQGVPAALITVKGLGESKPFMATEDGAQAPENRRVEILVK
ncbi:MAG: OmpA family protein [Alphaproteobacteria bacterium]|nr:OmpA family protein [Alphaproteobacteria bacterium]